MKKIIFSIFGYLFFILPSFMLALKAGYYVEAYKSFGADPSPFSQFMIDWHPVSFIFVAFVGLVYLIGKTKEDLKWLKYAVTIAGFCQIVWFYLVYAGLFLPIITLTKVI